jgi:hypothetical protein
MQKNINPWFKFKVRTVAEKNSEKGVAILGHHASIHSFMHSSMIYILLTKGSNFCLSFLGGIIDLSLFKNPPPLDSAEESAEDSR